MANNYMQASFEFECGTVANAIKVCDWLSGKEGSYPPDLAAQIKEQNGIDWDDERNCPEYLLIGASIVDEQCDEAHGVPPATTKVWVYSEEGSDLDATVAIFEYAMATMPEVPSPQGFSWACWCDKLRLDEFDGGAVMVCRGKPSEWISSSNWLSDRISALKQQAA